MLYSTNIADVLKKIFFKIEMFGNLKQFDFGSSWV